MVQISEATVAQDNAHRGLIISVSLSNSDAVETDFYEIKDFLLHWKRIRGKAATSVLIEYETPDSIRQPVEDFWLAKLENDHLIRNLFDGVAELTLCIMSQDGRNIRRIGFEFGNRHDSSA